MLDEKVSQEQTAPASPEQGSVAPETPQILDLDGVSEFTFQGEKFNPDRFHKIFSEHKSYGEKVKEYEKNSVYEQNLDVDLDNVLQDPRLADKFKTIYPQRYHARLDRELKLRQGQAQDKPAQSASVPKEFMTKLEQMEQRMQFHETRAYEAEVAAASAKLEATLPPLFNKFKLANEDQVYSRAESLIQQGQKLTEKTWERLVRESHDTAKKKSDQEQSATLKIQMEKGQRGADVGPGGATPGSAPRKIRTFDDAREAAIASLTSQRG